MGEMIQLGGLWQNDDKDGQTFFSGYLGNAKLLIFKNGYKKEDKHPDYIMYVAAKEKKEDGNEASSAPETKAPF